MIPKTCTCGVTHVWAELPLVGHQPVEADGDEPAEMLELRNCTACGSTLAIDLYAAPTMPAPPSQEARPC